MNKRERVMAALEGRIVDRLPFALWRHFYAQDRTAQGLARATVNLYRHCDADLIVMMPGPLYMAEAWGADIRTFGSDDIPPYIVTPTVGRATDWRQFPELDIANSSLQREIEAVRIARSLLTPEDAPLILALYSPLTTANQLCAGRLLEDLRSFSNDLRSGLARIAQATIALGRACLNAGADGFMLINDQLCHDRLRPREYRELIEFDRQVLQGLAQASIRILSLPGENPVFEQVRQYDVHAIHWATWRSTPSLAAARQQVECCLMGGLNEQTFANGSPRDLQSQIADAIRQTDGRRLIIAPGGPLPPDSHDELIAAVHYITRSLSGK